MLACWIAVAAYSAYRSDQAMRQQLGQLQAQTSALSGQVQAQRQEVAYAGTSAWQAELARANGLGAPGQQTYVIETPAQVAGPGPVEQAATEVGSAVAMIAQGVRSLS
ncbi:MAG: hypothetical protein ACYCYK_02795 [Candidatus Dormibacteria bacterium]